jgi:hypothetical protein
MGGIGQVVQTRMLTTGTLHAVLVEWALGVHGTPAHCKQGVMQGLERVLAVQMCQ